MNESPANLGAGEGGVGGERKCRKGGSICFRGEQSVVTQPCPNLSLFFLFNIGMVPLPSPSLAGSTVAPLCAPKNPLEERGLPY